MAITNKNKEKSANLEEIENDESVIDPVTNTVTPPAPETTVEDLLAKDPDELTAAEIDILDKNKEDLTDEQKVKVGLMDEDNLDHTVEQPEEAIEEPIVEDEKEKKYKAQQTEAQIQFERNKATQDKVEEADNLPEPTEEELREYIRKEGSDLDELTNFEKSMAKKNFISERKLSLITDGIRIQKKVDEWASTIDTFIDSTDGKPEYLKLSSHESEFKKFAMQESHRGTPVDILLDAFVSRLPTQAPKRDSIFLKGGRGERPEKQADGISDPDYSSKLRVSDPREYRRQVKAGKIKIEID